MANVGPKGWYLRDGASGYTAVPAWTGNTVTAAGTLRRPTAATVGNERVVVAIIAGTTSATQPTWTTTKGARNTDGTVTWQECTGQPGVNGDLPIAVVTNASTAGGNQVLRFAAVPANVRVGMLAMHASLLSNVTVAGVTATSVVLTANATGTIASGQTVYFGNCPMWLNQKNTALTIGLIIYDAVTASLQIVSVAGTTGNAAQPSFSATAGTTTGDNTVTWTSLGLASSFANWAAPHAKIQNAFATNWMAPGDECFVADDHIQTQAIALSFTLSVAAATSTWCIDRTAALPSTSANLRSDQYTVTNPACAQIITTGNFAITTFGVGNLYGIVFSCGTGAVSSPLNATLTGRIEKCSLRKLGTVGNIGAIILNNGEFIDSTIQLGAVGDQIRGGSGGVSRWSNTPSSAVIGPFIPNSLISSNGSGNLIIDGVNFSAFGAGKTVVSSLSTVQTVRLIGINVGTGATIAAAPSLVGARTEATWVDNAAGTVQEGVWTNQGTLTHETVIVRSGSALSWRIVPGINNRWPQPFECPTACIYNAVVGSPITCTVYGIWADVTVPNNDDVWIDVAYFGNTASPLPSIATSTKANNFAQGVPLPSDSSVWGGSTTAFRMSATFTPQQAGPVRVTVRTANMINTMYIDPAPVLS
jgi:hypothetical protein